MLFSNIVILYSVYLAAKAAIEVPNAPPPMMPTFKEVSISVEKSFDMFFKFFECTTI